MTKLVHIYLLVKHRHPKIKTKAQAHKQYQTMSGKDRKAPNGANNHPIC